MQIHPIPLHQRHHLGVVGSYVFMQFKKIVNRVPPTLCKARAALHFDYIILERAETVMMQNTLRTVVSGQIHHPFVAHSVVVYPLHGDVRRFCTNLIPMMRTA